MVYRKKFNYTKRVDDYEIIIKAKQQLWYEFFVLKQWIHHSTAIVHHDKNVPFYEWHEFLQEMNDWMKFINDIKSTTTVIWNINNSDLSRSSLNIINKFWLFKWYDMSAFRWITILNYQVTTAVIWFEINNNFATHITSEVPSNL